MIRFFDLIFSLFGVIFLLPVALILLIIGLFDTGSPIYLQKRVGKDKKPFTLVKFRTMKIGTESVASHLADKNDITKFGFFLRRTKLDELPQLLNVILGDMSLVGPRPCLFNQVDVIMERDKLGVFNYLPGITGLSQINDIDMSTPKTIAKYDAEMYEDFNIKKYFYYIFATFGGKGQGDRIK